ncbi:hypothetical protein K458DRAFT_485581 [Lentithecium fluviatile CBS 122367]|uniref:F-box domain-containing protein n=1 Tax=Lentithecium fluviatile CBS 122367 TaxID=1168545 RepID=A0A6G1JAC2_9PLEO|nr:hypothetical protein K458DRAFT_485581 [Lentithecium fluviatile CBS 122367]
MAVHLPVDIWLLVFDQLDDLAFLWGICRNISSFFRDCVNRHLRHVLSQNWLIDLHYSDVHTRDGHRPCGIHVPMVFDRFSVDGARIFFQQRAYKDLSDRYYKGSVRGWVPFIERYCEETLKPPPRVLHKSEPSDGAPLWEQMHAHWRNALSGDAKTLYLSDLRGMISIGRGDQPPYYLRIFDTINDTELVDLEIDCKTREISFDWRETYALFFREQDYVARARPSNRKDRVHDVDLAGVDIRNSYHRRKDHDPRIRARRKRLAPWVAKNKHRLSTEMRWWTEDDVYSGENFIGRMLSHDKLCKIEEGTDAAEAEEIVPARLADDHADLLMWPWGDENRSFVPRRRSCSSKDCVIL